MRTADLLVVYRDPKALAPYARNSRTHSAEQIAQIRGSIREFGFTNPILLKDDERTIGAGHARTLAAIAEGIERVPTITLPGLTETQWRAYVIADNKLALNAGWDDELLKLEFGELGGLDFDLTLTGFSLDAIGDLMNPQAPGQSGAGSLADKFMVVPFSVLNAREGWWQDRKRAWLALGIQSELGRGENALDVSASMVGIDAPEEREAWNAARRKLKGANAPHEGSGMADGLVSLRAKQKANATPGCSPRPAADYSKRQRGDGTGRAIGEG